MTTSGTTETATAGRATSVADVSAGLRALDEALAARLRRVPSLIVAYSGGVDSAYLAWRATRVLGDAVLCVTAESPSYPEHHREMAVRIARDFGLRHEFVRTTEVDQPAYRRNGPDRCYHCKHELYTRLRGLATERGISAIADGSNADDRGDYRPGRQAAREFGVLSPLDDVGLTKDGIRVLSKAAGLPTWDAPASACLASRVPYHTDVTPEKLRVIEAAEAAVRACGFRLVRVRHHGEVARIEVGRDELARAVEPAVARDLEAALTSLGFRFVTLDLRGYRLGSLNEALTLRQI